MRVGAVLRLAAAAYPDGESRFARYWDFARGRPAQGTGDLLAAFIVAELAETHTTEANSRQLLFAAAKRLESAATQLQAVAAHLRSRVPPGDRGKVIQGDFSAKDGS